MPRRPESASWDGAPKKGGILYEAIKATVLAIVAGIVGYAGGLVMPPAALYDRLFRQDPNIVSGSWVGQVGGTNAALDLQELSGRQLQGTLTIKFGHSRTRTLKVEGNHDFNVVLQADWDAARVLKIGLTRTVGERNGPNDPYVMLMQPDPKAAAARICPTESLNIAECTSVGDGTAFFSRDARGLR